MTQPTLPSDMPRGTMLVRPSDDPDDTVAMRMLKTADQSWVQVSGEYSAGRGPLALYNLHADTFLAGWPETTVAAWQAATGMS